MRPLKFFKREGHDPAPSKWAYRWERLWLRPGFRKLVRVFAPMGLACALGIAGTQAAGLKSMFGTMCKPLHAGKAARNGLMAATLAERGFTSRDDVLDCAQGFTDTQTATFQPVPYPRHALQIPPGLLWHPRHHRSLPRHCG